MVQGRYIMGLKEGDWKYYNESGDLSLRITFKDGIEVEYNAVKIEPELKISELE
jgi:antitoxin component YwqK of YwqJK toxin-antitoxin module